MTVKSVQIRCGNPGVTGSTFFECQSCYSNVLNSDEICLLSVRVGRGASGQTPKLIEEKKDNWDSGSIRWQMPGSPS